MRIKRYLCLCVVALLVCAGVAGCGGVRDEYDIKDAYVIITKSGGNPYNDHLANGFRTAVTAAGRRAVILEPDKATAEAQIALIDACIQGGAKAIAIAANDTTALDEVLQQAMARGIQVSTVDANTNADSHAVFVNQVSAEILAQCLMDAVYRLADGEGSWAILSTTNQAGNQNAWIRQMQAIMTAPQYRQLRLVDIAFGEDDAALSRQKVQDLLLQYPDLKVLCVPTVVGMRAAAEVLQDSGAGIRLTGLGLPSEMAPYMQGEDPLCPVMYLWDPISVGRLSAYVSMALTDGTITGAAGEVLYAPDGTAYTIVESLLGGTEVIVDEPQEFTADNIEAWQDRF